MLGDEQGVQIPVCQRGERWTDVPHCLIILIPFRRTSAASPHGYPAWVTEYFPNLGSDGFILGLLQQQRPLRVQNTQTRYLLRWTQLVKNGVGWVEAGRIPTKV